MYNVPIRALCRSFRTVRRSDTAASPARLALPAGENRPPAYLAGSQAGGWEPVRGWWSRPGWISPSPLDSEAAPCLFVSLRVTSWMLENESTPLPPLALTLPGRLLRRSRFEGRQLAHVLPEGRGLSFALAHDDITVDGGALDLVGQADDGRFALASYHRTLVRVCGHQRQRRFSGTFHSFPSRSLGTSEPAWSCARGCEGGSIGTGA